MSHDEFAFFNRQLGAMLKSGIPLEGALKQLATGMREGALRSEITQLESALESGTTLPEAIAKRNLPPMYRRMMQIGAAGNDLPGMLNLIADHYERSNSLWTRLKGLMAYPVLVVVVALGLTLLTSVAIMQLVEHGLFSVLRDFGSRTPSASLVYIVWVPPVLLALLVVGCVLAMSRPQPRAWLRWRLPGFREASLAQLASSMALMLRNGMPLAEALAMSEMLEAATPAAGPLRQWREMTEAGQGDPAKWPIPTKPIPPLFLWVIQNGAENLSAAFQKAADIYHARASYRIEMLLYGVLPVSVVLLGQMILWQLIPLVQALTWFMNTLGSFD
jgi:type II secretory pathway component PulF